MNYNFTSQQEEENLQSFSCPQIDSTVMSGHSIVDHAILDKSEEWRLLFIHSVGTHLYYLFSYSIEFLKKLGLIRYSIGFIFKWKLLSNLILIHLSLFSFTKEIFLRKKEKTWIFTALDEYRNFIFIPYFYMIGIRKS